MVDAVVRAVVAARRMRHDAIAEQRFDLGRLDRRRREDAHTRRMTLRIGDREPLAAGERVDRIDAIGAAADHQIFAALHRSLRSEEHTSEIKSLMLITDAVSRLKNNTRTYPNNQA